MPPSATTAMRADSGAPFSSPMYVTATAAGEALQEGRLGQTIQVQNVDSKKTLLARVVGPGLVEIDLGGAP